MKDNKTIREDKKIWKSVDIGIDDVRLNVSWENGEIYLIVEKSDFLNKVNITNLFEQAISAHTNQRVKEEQVNLINEITSYVATKIPEAMSKVNNQVLVDAYTDILEKKLQTLTRE